MLIWGNKERGGRGGVNWNLDPYEILGSRITRVVLFYLFLILGAPVIVSPESPSSGLIL